MRAPILLFLGLFLLVQVDAKWRVKHPKYESKHEPKHAAENNDATHLINPLPEEIASQSFSPTAVKRPNMMKRQITEGTPARPMDAPWQFFMFCTFTNISNAFCGGTLISEWFGLTAAHCICEPEDKEIMAKLCKITAGGVTIDTFETNEQTRQSAKLIVHPKYNPKTLAFDMGVIKFDSAFKMGGRIWFATLPSWSDRNNNFKDAVCTTAGYGSVVGSDVSTMSEKLVKTELKTIALSDCTKNENETTICTVGKQSGGICFGDGGSALMYEESCLRTILIGIAAYVKDYNCMLGKGGFINVAKNLDFIEAATESTIPIRK